MATLLFARPDGQWFDFPPLEMAGSSGERLRRPDKADLIPLPEGATLAMMPGAWPVGFDKETGEFLSLAENPYKKKSEPVWAIAALLPQGFTRLLLPAETRADESMADLPILGYTAVGVEKGKLVVAAAATDEHERWHPKHFNTPALAKLAAKRQQEFPGNAVIAQLSHCSLEYGCFTAQNILHRRWEGGIPASPGCNAACRFCLSETQEQGAEAPQQRITACPQALEIADVAAAHLAQAENAIISFGQGCEGEPSLVWPVLSEALREIRSRTKRGILNINTNASDPEAIRALLDAGMDSLRVSLFSAVPADYEAYHRPKNYSFADVCASLAIAAAAGRPVALNLLAYPGFTDDIEQKDALVALVKRYQIAMIQLRNLNCDPCSMAAFCQGRKPLGMRAFLQALRQELPETRIGNYSADLR